MAPQTVLHEMNCLSHAFNLAMKEWGWVIHNPCMNVKKPKVNNQILRWLSQDEEEALLPASQSYLHGQLPEIITVALHTGMRQGEILTLRWKNIDLFRKTITVMQGKTNEPKTIPMSETLFTLLTSKSKIVNMSGYVFHTGNGTRISGPNLQREFWKVLEKAKIESFRFHDLRHTFATRLIQNGVDLYSVSKLLGHRDVKMTQRYAHHHTESLRQCITVLDNCIVQNKQRELKR
jgi:integrase